MRLSVLDQSPIPAGGSGRDALAASLDLAREAERLGYHRFWLAEHHATPALASAVPEVMLARLAGETARIRIGSGGVMLPHQSPLRVAESFSMLAALAPGRIDLGLGRAPGSDPLVAFALQQDRRQRALQQFPAQLVELLGLFDGTLPADHPFRHLSATLPGRPNRPEIWLLGSSEDSAILAGELGLPWCFAEFIAGHRPDLARLYRHHFRGSPRASPPQIAVAAWCVAAASREEAHFLAGPARLMFARLREGELIPVPTPEEAARLLATRDLPERPGFEPVIGDPADMAERLPALAHAYGADELFLVNILHAAAPRLESYRLVARALGLEGEVAPEGAAAVRGASA